MMALSFSSTPQEANLNSLLRKTRLVGLLAITFLAFVSALSAQENPNEVALASDPNAAVLERGEIIFRLNECNYCHGIDLTQAPRGAKTDLKHNPLVGADESGNLIGPIVLNGLPRSQTSMPRFGDVITKDQLADLIAYIHFQRQAGRYKELVALKDSPGNAGEGQTYFDGAGQCGTCHSATDMAAAVKKLDDQTLKLDALHPAIPASRNTHFDEGYQAHSKMVERITDTEFLNVLAYLHSLK